jgi:FkbM family methyltransferase
VNTITVAPKDFHKFRVCVDEHSGDPLTGRLLKEDYGLLNEPVNLEKWVAPDTAFLDIGANIGCFSLVFAKQGHAVLAIEASPTNARLLSQSAAANALPELEIHNVAVSDCNTTITFHEAGPFGFVANRQTPNTGQTTQVDAVTLDGWPAAAQVPERVFIKMDIEGHEIHALRGMGQFLRQRNLPPMFVESNGHCLNWFGATPASLGLELESLGYTLLRCEKGFLRPWSPREPQVIVVENLLCVRMPDDRIHLPCVGSPRSPEEMLAEIEKAAAHPNPAQRAYLARTLAEFPILAGDPDVRRLIAPLKRDPVPAVRGAMNWAA